MLDTKLLRSNLPEICTQLKKRGFEFNQKLFSDLEAQRKAVQTKTESLQAARNQSAKAIGMAKAKGENVDELMKAANNFGEELKNCEVKLAEIQSELENYLLTVPNIPAEIVPVGNDETANVEMRKWGAPRQFNFTPLDHVALGEKNKLMDFERAAKLSGARFVVLHGKLAKLQRALAEFMLDVQTQQHGYQETYVPLLVHEKCLYGSGQLPKFSEESFETSGDFKFRLIPTSEVSLVNMFRDEIIEEADLPIKVTAHTACFRSEAGSYGKDTRGMIRQHQFQKVELVQLVKPEDSTKALEEMTQHAEKILQLLELPYRVLQLCTGDMGFAANQTYDLEVWLPGQNTYREISSCSNCGDFQARRMQTRYRNAQTKKPELLHTLNGSGLAVGRTLVAILENYQENDGRIRIPKVLQSYFGSEYL